MTVKCRYSVVVGKWLTNLHGMSQTEQYVDMFKEGIIDPVKVVRIFLLQYLD